MEQSRKPGYPVTLGDATANGAALAFLISRRYNFGILGGSADVHFLEQIRSRVRIGGALSRRADGPCPSPPCDLFDSKLGHRAPWQSKRRPEVEHFREHFRP